MMHGQKTIKIKKRSLYFNAFPSISFKYLFYSLLNASFPHTFSNGVCVCVCMYVYMRSSRILSRITE
jgi:hypothetical protein